MSTRRKFLQQLGAGIAVSYMGFPGLAQAASGPGTPLFVFVNLSGAADGLDIIRPVFESGYQSARSKVPNSMEGFDLSAGSPGLPFRLNPSLTKVHQLFAAGQATLFHAVGLDYTYGARAARSHFASQQMLQSMSMVPYKLRTGTLGRLSQVRASRSMADQGLIPTILQGPRKDLINTWSEKVGEVPTDDFVRRWLSLYPQEGAMTQAIKDGYKAALTVLPKPDERLRAKMQSVYDALQFGLVNGASQFSVQMGAWDTHDNEWDETGKNGNITTLNEVIEIIHQVFNARWNDLVVLVTSEFGRSVFVNGANGTDHGTGGMAMLLGGKVNGGKVVTRWPGMQPAQLYQGRDLAITLDVQQLHASVLSKHFNLSPAEQKAIFPMPLGTTPEFAADKLFRSA